MYPPQIAEQLRKSGHDAYAMTGRPDPQSLTDDDLFTMAQSEGRALVTENVSDMSRIANSYDARIIAHYGLVLVDSMKYPRGRSATIGRTVKALEELLLGSDTAILSSRRYWL